MSAAAICVFCASSTRIERHHLELAADLGGAIARRGHVLVSGGGRVGSMGEVARACRAAGGRTLGVIPQALVDLEVADHDADTLLITADMRERKGEMDRRSDAFIAIAGGLGTLEELLEIWVSRSLGMHGKPVVILDPDGVYAPLRQLVDTLAEQHFVRPEARDVVHWAVSVDDALDLIEREWAQDAVPAQAPVEEFLEAEP